MLSLGVDLKSFILIRGNAVIQLELCKYFESLCRKIDLKELILEREYKTVSKVLCITVEGIPFAYIILRCLGNLSHSPFTILKLLISNYQLEFCIYSSVLPEFTPHLMN